ncbi:secreted protein [Streptomyces zinciresistens K42]|uniref:Secreted protein n=2 Tax=Streptomyces TaxID=1883 RepID=G2GJJ8_9ACTN|nr:secreted protein [Streptomyces zinciresistens K42]
MVLSLGVTLLASGVIYLFIPKGDGTPDLPRVDYRVELLTARRAASYPVVAPQGLPESWKPTSVRFKGDQFDAWHLGFHTSDGQYVQVQQSADKPARFIEESSQGAKETKVTEKIGDRTWTRYAGGRYDALVYQEKGATTVVSGTGSFGQLRQMAAALSSK